MFRIAPEVVAAVGVPSGPEMIYGMCAGSTAYLTLWDAERLYGSKITLFNRTS